MAESPPLKIRTMATLRPRTAGRPSHAHLVGALIAMTAPNHAEENTRSFVVSLIGIVFAILSQCMEASTPVDWIEEWATTDFDRPALVFDDSVVPYGYLASEVSERARSLRGIVSSGEVVPVLAGLDFPSIVDLFAHMAVGAVPLPHDGYGTQIGGRGAENAVVCLSTSGTSGGTRLVPLTMANLTASVEASRARLGTGADDRWLACLPLTHIGGLSVFLRSFEAGAAAVVGAFGGATTSLIERAHPSVASVVPTMVHRLLVSDPEAIASIDRVLVGGATLSGSLAESARSAGANLVPTYGMTEASSQVATPSPLERGRRVGSVGHPLDGFSVTIASPGDDGAGRILVDGPAVFGGYLGEEPRTGPFVTSDVGLIEPDGSLTVLGRSDDVVITGGENVSLPSVQDALSSLTVVDGVAVVGVDDAEWGTVVCALVVASDLDAAKDAASGVLARHAVPRRWARADRIPFLPNGKVDVDTIRKHFEVKGT